MLEARKHPHNNARNSHISAGGMTQPHPAPRFDSVNYESPAAIPERGSGTAKLLRSVGCSEKTIDSLT